MKLPLHHLHRLRRKLRRVMTADDRARRHLIEEFCGRRLPPRSTKPPDRMKNAFLAFLLLIVVLAILGLTSCATVESKTTVTAPDGTVTVTESKTTAPDPASVAALGNTAMALTPRAVIVHPAK